jgi:diguanylate cyclase (GGDEF)-like protein/PAS domain S-box-containing protein
MTETTPELTALLRAAGSHPVIQGFPEGAIVVFDEDLRYLSAGGQGLASVGLTPTMMEGKSIYDVFPPEIASTLEPAYRKVLGGEEAILEISVADQTYLHRIAPLIGSDGQVAAGIGYAFDVTAARQKECELRESEESLRTEQRRLRDAEAIGHSGSWEWDTVADTITWSDGLFALHGLSPTTITNGYTEAASRVHPDDRLKVDEAMEDCRTNGGPVRFRYRILAAGDEGSVRWFDSYATGVFESGELVRLVGAVADVTDQVQAEIDVLAANAFQQAVIAASPDFTFITDIRTNSVIYGSRNKDVLGITADETKALGSDAIDVLVHPDDQDLLRNMNAAARELDDGDVLTLRYRARHADGRWLWLSRHIVPFRRDESGSVIEILGVLRDISDVVAAETQLSHDALHDGLTGLPNRSLLIDRLEAALARSSREGREIAVLFCDLDGFKEINDTAGHAAGDAVLIEAARRLRSTVREEDTVARVGGDEFVIIVEPWSRSPIPDPDGIPYDDRLLALRVADRIVKSLRVPIVVGGVTHGVTISVGVTYTSLLTLEGVGELSANKVLEQADEAMYRAKHHGKNCVEVFAQV